MTRMASAAENAHQSLVERLLDACRGELSTRDEAQVLYQRTTVGSSVPGTSTLPCSNTRANISCRGDAPLCRDRHRVLDNPRYRRNSYGRSYDQSPGRDPRGAEEISRR